MKLLELLIERPHLEIRYDLIAQDTDGVVYSYDTPPKIQNGVWIETSESAYVCDLDVAEDYSTSVVSGKQLRQANQLLSEGYTLWFGGENPVPGKTVIVILTTGDRGTPCISEHLPWSGTEIIAYKVIDEKDNVNRPSRYTNGEVECIDALKAATVGKTGIEAVCVANVIKYLWRYEDKNGVEDVKKAQWYINRLLEELQK